ncbi:hypothetical protein, partial [Lactococcus petauri]|uniref:hypothetical protein n=1 Tax=Lactococcus petauri TaxID=1940789 RepID=UPI003BF53B40
GVPIRIETDARIAHAAYFPNGDGILTIAGTGAVSFGHRGEKQFQWLGADLICYSYQLLSVPKTVLLLSEYFEQ